MRRPLWHGQRLPTRRPLCPGQRLPLRRPHCPFSMWPTKMSSRPKLRRGEGRLEAKDHVVQLARSHRRSPLARPRAPLGIAEPAFMACARARANMGVG